MTVAVISRDVLFWSARRPSISSPVSAASGPRCWENQHHRQIVAIAAIIFAERPYGTGYYLPTIYTTVFALAVLSGAHYVFFVSKLVNEDRRDEETHSTKVDKNALGIILSERSRPECS